MSTSTAHRRTHNLLLISKLLSQRDQVSPLTVIFDTLEAPAKPLLREYARRAQLGRTHTVLLGFETVVAPPDIDAFVPCYDKAPGQILRALEGALRAGEAKKRCLVLIDSMMSLAMRASQPGSGFDLVGFLSSILRPSFSSSTASGPVEVSLVAVYHSDVLVDTTRVQYSPTPRTLLSYMATTVITVHSLAVLLAEKAARERSLPVPLFGLAQEMDGVVVGLKPQSSIKPADRGIVLEMEHRRKSGRGVLEWYFLPETVSKVQSVQTFREPAILLDDHPLFRDTETPTPETADKDLAGLTFELGLTERQRLERDGVVLPYFDAQKGGGTAGPGEGGRILYDMGVEDDFDEEEDEI